MTSQDTTPPWEEALYEWSLHPHTNSQWRVFAGLIVEKALRVQKSSLLERVEKEVIGEDEPCGSFKEEGVENFRHKAGRNQLRTAQRARLEELK